MKNQKGFVPVIILLIVLAVVVIAGGAYYLGTQKSLTPSTVVFTPSASPTPMVSPTSVASMSPTPSPTKITTSQTANWKTYTSSIYGFSFQYPSNMTIKEVNPQYVSINSTDDQNFLILILVGDNKEKLPAEQFFFGQSSDNMSNTQHFNTKQVSLGSVSALRIVLDGDAFSQSSTPLTNYVITSGVLGYVINTNEYAGKFDGTSTNLVPSDSNSLYQRILATFKLNQ